MTDIQGILEQEEGFVPHAYKDSLGYWTIGHGILIDKNKGGGITEEESRYLMGNRLYKIRDELNHRLPWLWGQPTDCQDALVLMAYQMGVGGVCDFHHMLAHMESGDRAEAADEALKSLWARQTPVRAKRVADMIRGRVAAQL